MQARRARQCRRRALARIRPHRAAVDDEEIDGRTVASRDAPLVTDSSVVQPGTARAVQAASVDAAVRPMRRHRP
jgi:hypothetical protein